ncbi:LysR family transcriptional regulator [Litoreibacter roseus]|uniref:LysR family transcriptional regulator n=1 Tax=Litoreibacter roseus TaxID=2601869 RepID=A0A6N6JKZ8_9RHOB|nr:LysR family transcriptional regulator [Litoreibacter roseus]GFE67003.1 LysR family transcriptional regulator [Litoreibacter roseus]
MNLASVDLNLLVAFDAIMAERSVGEAAKRLGISQPGMSKRLANLRLLMRDELFLRTKEGLKPTEKALDLAEPVRSALAGLETALGGHRAFQPETSHRTFRISATDHIAVTLLPPLMQRLRKIAPRVTLVIRFENRLTVAEALEKGDLDIALTILPDAPAAIQRLDLFKENYICLASENHPEIRDDLTLGQFMKYPHILVTMAGDTRGFMDRLLADYGLKRQVAISLPYNLVVPELIAQTDMLATMPTRVARLIAWKCVRSFPVPIDVAGYRETMLWHGRNDSDPAHRWLRKLIEAVSRDVDIAVNADI